MYLSLDPYRLVTWSSMLVFVLPTTSITWFSQLGESRRTEGGSILGVTDCECVTACLSNDLTGISIALQ